MRRVVTAREQVQMLSPWQETVPSPEENVSAACYADWCSDKKREPFDLDNAAEYVSGYGQWEDAKPIYEWIKPHLGRVAAAPEGYSTSYEPGDDRVYAHDHALGEPVGFLAWHPNSNEISQIFVRNTHTRRGLGRAMLEHAAEVNPDLKPSPTLTDKGAEFAKSFGYEPEDRIHAMRGSDATH